MLLDEMTDAEFERHALTVLYGELGLGGVARSLRLNKAGPGDYTRDRAKWLDGLGIQNIMQEIAAAGHASQTLIRAA